MKEFPTDTLTLLAIVLVTYRLSRLLAVDTFPPAVWFRQKVWKWTDEFSTWAYLVECMHCNSWWLALIVGGTAWTATPTPEASSSAYEVVLFFGVALGTSAIVGLIADNLLEDEEE